MKKIIFALAFVCLQAFGQTYNTLDTGGVVQSFQHDAYPFIYIQNSTLSAGGVLTPVSALPKVYANAYFQLPASAFASGTQNWYYGQCSTTTSCNIYTYTYPGGTPASPSSGLVLATGSGTAFTQTTATYVTGQTFTLPGNAIGLTGKFIVEVGASTVASANTKYIGATFGGTALTATNAANSVAAATHTFKIKNTGQTNSQTVISESTQYGAITYTTIDTTQPQTLGIRFYLNTATEYLISEWVDVSIQK